MQGHQKDSNNPKLLFQFVAFFALVAVATSSPIVATPYGLAAPVGIAKTVEFDANPHYSYTYSVNDALTGDSKSQSESRQGDVVTGQYSFIEADGTRRIVDYTADDINGFNAVVRKEGAVAKVVAPVVAKVGFAHGALAHPAYGYGAVAHAPLHAGYGAVAHGYPGYAHSAYGPAIAKPFYG